MLLASHRRHDIYEYKAQIVTVTDGDTVRADIDLGCDVRLRLTLRLAGINAPEMSTLEGPVAKAWLTDVVGAGQLVMRTIKDRREKFGRYLGYLWRVDEGVFTDWGFTTDLPSINERMVTAGQAVVYK